MYLGISKELYTLTVNNLRHGTYLHILNGDHIYY